MCNIQLKLLKLSLFLQRLSQTVVLILHIQIFNMVFCFVEADLRAQNAIFNAVFGIWLYAI